MKGSGFTKILIYSCCFLVVIGAYLKISKSLKKSAAEEIKDTMVINEENSTEANNIENTQIQNNKVIYSFFGAPGAGKGTLAAQCVEKLGYQVLSTGDLCRKNVAMQTEIGKQVEQFMKEGKLVPDDLVIDMVKDWLLSSADKEKPVILDGFPRTKEQAEKLTVLLKDIMPEHQLKVVSINLPEDEIVSRLSNRLVCENKACQTVYNTSMPEAQTCVCSKCNSQLIKREDDKEDVIRERLKVYKDHETPILEFYKSTGLNVEELNISKLEKDEVFELFKQKLA